jgi:hypothetical protein
VKAEAQYEEIKQVYIFLNDEVKQQLQAYNSQRMLYIMPHLEKVPRASSCHYTLLMSRAHDMDWALTRFSL